MQMKIENFSVKYTGKVVFENFNLDIIDGEVTCILGCSGVGKTTLLHHIASKAQSENKKIAIAFQEPRLFSHLTVYENLKLIGYSESEIKLVLKKVGLESKINAYPNSLSGGERQRVNLARAFLRDCDVLLLDEPFFSLDVKLKVSLIEYIIKEKLSKTIVFVTHDVDEALSLSNRIILLKEGKVSLDYRIDKNLNERQYGKLIKERDILMKEQLK